MKKLFIILGLLIVGRSGYAQFVLTQKGFVNAAAPDTTYFVQTFSNIKKEALFKAVRLFMYKSFPAPRETVSQCEYDVISISQKENMITNKNSEFLYHLEYEYTISFQFKDNKIRVNAPQIKNAREYRSPSLILGDGRVMTGYELLNKRIWDQDEKRLVDPVLKKMLEYQFNTLVQAILNSATDKDEW